MLILLLWIILGIFNFCMASYYDYIRYNDYYKDLTDLYISLALSIIPAPCITILLFVCIIKENIKSKKKGSK